MYHVHRPSAGVWLYTSTPTFFCWYLDACAPCPDATALQRRLSTIFETHPPGRSNHSACTMPPTPASFLVSDLLLNRLRPYNIHQQLVTEAKSV